MAGVSTLHYQPRMIAFHCFLDEPGDKFTVVQLHLDYASMEFLHIALGPTAAEIF